MSEQDNITIARKVIDGFNSHNLDATVQYLADSVRGELPGTPEYTTKDQLRNYNRAYLEAYPDLHFDIRDIVAQGDKVAIFWDARGTQKGALKTAMGSTIPPTNKLVRLPGVTFIEVRDGLVIRSSAYFDLMSMMTQMGVITPEELMAHGRH